MQLILSVRFYCSTTGNELVKDWLKDQVSVGARKAIGVDIKTVQFGWPIGMPVVRKMGTNLWEVRSHIPEGIARVLFTVVGTEMVLLHGFVKKSRDTPKVDLDLSFARMKEVKK